MYLHYHLTLRINYSRLVSWRGLKIVLIFKPNKHLNEISGSGRWPNFLSRFWLCKKSVLFVFILIGLLGCIFSFFPIALFSFFPSLVFRTVFYSFSMTYDGRAVHILISNHRSGEGHSVYICPPTLQGREAGLPEPRTSNPSPFQRSWTPAASGAPHPDFPHRRAQVPSSHFFLCSPRKQGIGHAGPRGLRLQYT